MRNTTRSTQVLLILIMTSLFLAFGCGKKESKVVQEQEQDVDLSQSEDIFEKAPKAAEKSMSADTVIAKVEGKEILFSDLQNELDSMLASARSLPPKSEMQKQIPTLLSRALDSMIMREILAKAIENEDVEVAEAEVIKQLRQINSKIPGDKKLSEVLAERDITLEEFKEQLAKDMSTQKLVEIHTAEAKEPTEKEIEEFYKANSNRFVRPETANAHHILIGFEEDEDEGTKKAKLQKIKEIRKKIVAGADFKKMAREHSTGPSAEKGGDLGEFPRGRMLEEFDEAVFSQDVGEVGEPIETKFGYHLIRVDERNESKKIPLEEAKDMIKSRLSSRNQQEVLSEYMQKLREQADIEILTDLSKVDVKIGHVLPESSSTE